MKKVANENIKLIDFLMKSFNELSHKKIKSLLKYENILVNNIVVTKYDYNLKSKDVVEIKEYKTKKHPKELKIIYEDKDIIVIDKPSGLLTMSTKKEKDKTLYHMVSEYLKQTDKSSKIYIVHRLDKETSGIVLFAKNIKTKNIYQNNWNEIVKSRKYVAIIEGRLEKKEGKIATYLTENEQHFVYSTNPKIGKLAVTKYKVIKENSKYSYINVELETGRKNQIRVHFSEMGHPIIGDKKYGSQIDSIKRLGLHANELKIKNPFTNKIDDYESEIPSIFQKIIK